MRGAIRCFAADHAVGFYGDELGSETPTDQGRRTQAGGLRDRLAFAGLDADQCDLLRRFRPMLEQRLKEGLRDFFHRLQSSPDAMRFFQSDNQLERFHDLQASHWSVLTDARFDALYAERVKVLSDAEGRMGLDPRWHIAGHAVMLENLVDCLLQQIAGKALLTAGRKREREISDAIRGVIRLVMVDVEIAISLRFNELRIKHQRVLAEQKERDHAETANLFGPVLTAMAEKDLTARMPLDVPDAYRELSAILDQALEAISAAVRSAADKLAVAEASASVLSQEASAFASDARRNSEELGRLSANWVRWRARFVAMPRKPWRLRRLQPRLAVPSPKAGKWSGVRSTPWPTSRIRLKRSARSSG